MKQISPVCCCFFFLALAVGCTRDSGQASGHSRDRTTDEAPAQVQLPESVRQELGDLEVDYYEVSHQGRRLWCYIPRVAPGKRVPCILIAPAGSSLCTGMALGEGDRPEHVPYLKSGFAVIAFDLSGATTEDTRGVELENAIRAFMAADGGLDDGRAAVDYALNHFPIDPERVYAAGHSSAAAFALYFAANEPRIQGVVAYMPPASVRQVIGTNLVDRLDRVIPGFAAFAERISPSNCSKDIRCPVFLFGSKQDEVVPLAELDHLNQTLRAAGVPVEYVLVDKGDHYGAMIEQGIPAGIQWLKGLRESAAQN
ncbi:MAG: hypothetical protein KatS3mg015_2005 [Fimbriimonadales bacterium]|nr:MAG: hypothetical protein KatS3mg015_2005 [Fimbriimonadales bacterium]